MRRISTYLVIAAVPLTVFCAALYFLSAGPEDSRTPEVAASHAPSIKPAPTLDLPGVKETDAGFDFDDEMKSKLQAVGDAYEAQASFPAFSQPISPDELEGKYRGNTPVASDLPADLTDPNSPSISILTDRFRYYPGDRLAANAAISGLPPEESSAVTAQLLRGNEEVAQASVTSSQDQPHSYYLDFSALQFDDVSWKEELTVQATFSFRGEQHLRSATVEYVSTIGSVDGVAQSRVQEEYLQIPVHVSTEKPGRHRLQANLYDASTGEPLVHLNAEDNVDSTGSLVLKAHIGALKASGSEGPYTLGDLVFTRMPTSPKYITEYGRVNQERYQVGGHSFDDYLDKPYVNQKATRIARELRRIGS
ncbi:hypothetical protein QQF73_11490 [Marinobacter sp. M216]|uniref:Uncharacterized protein n=1 Tax=Marinobacter albus TaxID=3030833 RepID=A0ABT7HDY7_9GAMM|nr:hypothetical protein [Marinobacter sp. M216]MDK9558244.1 hypothetical protein [Marinobacter sp. M216]